MIETILGIVKMILAILPFVVLCLFSRKINLPKPDRNKQFLAPVFAVVYLIVVVFFLNNINNWLIKIIVMLPKLIAYPATILWLPKAIGDFFVMLSGLIATFLGKLNLGFWIFFISNAAIILVYLILKKIVIKFIDKTIKCEGDLHAKIAGTFYECFPEKNIWCIKEEYVHVRSMLRVFYYSAVVLSALLMIISRYFYYDGLMKTVFYPVFGIILVGELYFYLDGATKKEYTEEILGEDEDAYKTVNYSLLRKFLRSVFGDKLLTENTSINNSLVYDVTTDEIIRELEKSEDQKVSCFASYMDALNRTGVQLDHNYLYSSLDLLNGKNILFNNPFYNDLIPYAFYPMNRALLSHQKVLVILGRHAIEDDIKEWIERGIESVTNIPFLWNTGVLTSEEHDLDIGIVTRSDVLNIELHNANSEFLDNVGFVMIIEPSKLISTAQIGLNLLVKKCRGNGDKEIVYCMCDKNCDGLVDAMSHILMTNITEVSATNKHIGTSSYMCWEADDEYLHHRLVPNISRYLGLGTELSLAALKNQVSKTKWYGGEAFPVTDIRWIDRQYYYDLTKYANLPSNQESLEEHFETTSNFWSAEIEKNCYLTVEDESFNMFEILRDFSTRTTEQGFINIISSEYLLKDYMAENASLFETDAKAIPCIVADYTRSNRNTILRLILQMSTYPVCEKNLEKEMSLLGIAVFDLKKQLWYELYNCYSKVAETVDYPEDYRKAVNTVYDRTIKIDGVEWTHDIIRVRESFNLKLGDLETTYHIADADFLRLCVLELRSAEYIAEDEKGQRYYLGSELCGHIYQKYLPGQFFTFGGKYYEMQYLTADGQVLVRRAADHITGRPSYRQIREYVIHGTKPSEKIGAQQNIAGMKIINEFADISVSTPGYYKMDRYNDFATAKCISFEGEKNGIPKRLYHNKQLLRIELPDLDGKMTDKVRYTITLLFNEIFKTIFAENQAYICAVTDESFLEESDETNPLSYSIRGEGCEIQKNAIYIIEDSQLDLGLIVTVERNLQRIFGIIHDYLDWHLETLEASLVPPVEPEPPVTFTEGEPLPTETETPKKGLRGALSRVKDKIKGAFKRKRRNGDAPADGENPEGDNGETTEKKKKGLAGLFGRKKKKGSEEPVAEQPVVDPAEDPLDIPEVEPVAEEPVDVEDAEPAVDFAQEPFTLPEFALENEVSESTEAEQAATVGFSTEKKPYHERYYLLYGKDYESSLIDISGTLSYLAALGLQKNELKKTRESKKIAELIEATYQPGRPDARYCDFCGAEIYGVEYETLADGRDRCLNCGRTAIKTGEEFRKIFEDVKRNMESFFGIKINVGIKVEMVNSKKLHKRLGKAYIPTPASDGRVLGVAIKDKNGYSLLVENGSPRMASMLTMAHELTHIWQYVNWKDKAITKKYGKNMRLEIYEGMAKWVEIQYAYLINEPATAKREEIMTAYRDDEYGRGFLRYCAAYPFSTGTVITKMTPFMDIETPLGLEYCGNITVKMPTGGVNPGDVEGDKTPSPPGPAKLPVGTDKGPIERDPASLNKYAYSLLDESEKAVYDAVLEAVNNFVGEINTMPASVTDDQVKKITDYLHRDHPEIFWFRHGATFFFDTATHIVNRIELKYCMTQKEAESRKEKIDKATKSFLTAVTDTMSDYEATLHIYQNIINLVDYDTIGLERQKKAANSSPEIPDDLRSIYGVFVNKKAVCAGYAKAFQYLLNLCGIECTYVTSDTHAWNLIKLEGDYYHIDVTWGDGSDTKKEKASSSAINYDCFCITTEEVLRLDSHIPEDVIPLPECTATKCNYHRRHGLYFENYSYDDVRNIVSESVGLGRTDISFKFGSADALNAAKTELIDNNKMREVIQYAGLKTNVKLNTSYRYSVSEERQSIAFFLTKV